MAGRNRGRAGDKAVAYLAVTVVLAGGLLFCSLVVLLFSPDPMRVFTVMGGIAVGAVFLIWLVRDHGDGRSLQERYGGLVGLKHEKQKVQVKVKRVKRSEQAGPNRPPTADEIRELSGGINTWVPSSRQRQSDDDD